MGIWRSKPMRLANATQRDIICFVLTTELDNNFLKQADGNHNMLLAIEIHVNLE